MFPAAVARWVCRPPACAYKRWQLGLFFRLMTWHSDDAPYSMRSALIGAGARAYAHTHTAVSLRFLPPALAAAAATQAAVGGKAKPITCTLRLPATLMADLLLSTVQGLNVWWQVAGGPPSHATSLILHVQLSPGSGGQSRQSGVLDPHNTHVCVCIGHGLRTQLKYLPLTLPKRQTASLWPTYSSSVHFRDLHT